MRLGRLLIDVFVALTIWASAAWAGWSADGVWIVDGVEQGGSGSGAGGPTNYQGSVGFAWGADTGSVVNVFYSGRFDDPGVLTEVSAVVRNGGGAVVDVRYHEDWELTNCIVVVTGLVVGAVATNVTLNEAVAAGSGLSVAATNGVWTNLSVNASYTGSLQ
jgi:hypothetical protein